MNFAVITKDNYCELVKYLESLADNKYKEFHSTIVNNSDYQILGIKTPVLKDIAKQVLKGDYKGYLKNSGQKYYEEVMIRGLVSAQIKTKSFDEAKNLTLDFLPYIDNWALCDGYCSSFKRIKNYLREYFNFIDDLVNNDNVWYKRVGLVLMLNYYLTDEYIDRVIERCTGIDSDEYYVQMAQAWLLATAYLKYSEKVSSVLRGENVSFTVKRMTIQKCIDSYRVSQEDKILLKKLRAELKNKNPKN